MADYKSLFAVCLKQNDIAYTNINETTLQVTFSGDNADTIDVYIFFDEDGDNLVTFRSWGFASFKNKNLDAGYQVCNTLNCKYRWVKFFIDEDGDVNAQCDAVLDERSSSTECLQLMGQILKLVDEAYPVIMKTLWA